LIKDYDLTINYTLGKANVVADALSRKSTDTQPMSRELPKELLMDLERLEIQCLEVESLGSLPTMKVMEERQSDLKYTIFCQQSEDPFIEEEIRRIEEGRPSEFRLDDFNSLWFHNRICVPDITKIKQLILKEAHKTPYSIHPGSTKIYMDLKELFWWNNMKREIANGLMQPMDIPEWKWEEIGMDFIIGLPLTPKKKDMIWVIIDRLTKSAHFLAVNQKDSREKLVNLHVQEIVSKHGVPKTIVSNRGFIFTSAFWKQLHEALGSRLDFSTAYHP
jgi:hypothetical protein